MSDFCHETSENFSDAVRQSLRFYRWLPRSEVGFIQATVDASEGLARLRTERHSDHESCDPQAQSLVLFMTHQSRLDELEGLLAALSCGNA